jgi:hypothetical protein
MLPDAPLFGITVKAVVVADWAIACGRQANMASAAVRKHKTTREATADVRRMAFDIGEILSYA